VLRSRRDSEILPTDLFDFDRHAFLFGVFGAAEHVARALVAGEGKDKVGLFVQHFGVASETGVGVIFAAIGAGANQCVGMRQVSPIGRHADQRDVGLPVTPFLRQGISAGRTALNDGDGTIAAPVVVEGAPDQVSVVIGATAADQDSHGISACEPS
jgi:hypothetical protein